MSDGQLMWQLIQALFLFALVLVLVWWSTRFIALRMGGVMRGRALRILEHVPAGRDRAILLLEVGGRLYLVGATAQSISLLDTIEDPNTIQRILEGFPEGELSPGLSLPGSFREVLQRAMGRTTPGSGPAEAPAASPAAEQGRTPADSEEIRRLQEQIERLRRLQK